MAQLTPLSDQAKQTPKRLPSMTMNILLLRRKLRKRSPQIGKIKHRIVAKSTVPLRRLQNQSIRAMADNGYRLPALHKRNHANKISLPPRPTLPAQFPKQFRIPFGAVSPRSRVPSRPHSRRPTQRWHHKSRIVRKHKSIPRSRIVQRLPQRILCKRRRIFLKRRQRIEPRRQFQLNRRTRESRRVRPARKRTKLLKFSWIT